MEMLFFAISNCGMEYLAERTKLIEVVHVSQQLRLKLFDGIYYVWKTNSQTN